MSSRLRLDGLVPKSHGVLSGGQKDEPSSQRRRVTKAVKRTKTPRFPERGSLKGKKVNVFQEAQYSSRSPQAKEAPRATKSSSPSAAPLTEKEIERIKSFRIPVKLPEEISLWQSLKEGVFSSKRWIPISTADSTREVTVYFDADKILPSEKEVFKSALVVPSRLLQKTIRDNNRELRRLLLKREKEERLGWTDLNKEEIQQAKAEEEKEESEIKRRYQHYYRLITKATVPPFEELHAELAGKQAEVTGTHIRSGLFEPEGADNE